MLVQKLSNGQIQVTQANLILTHTDFHGLKINSCEIENSEYIECVKSSDERFKPLFIALINFKNQNP